MLLRTKDTRATFDLNTTDAETGVAGNYYPINSMIAVNDETNTVAILVDRAQAGGSMSPGSIDLMMHRRVTGWVFRKLIIFADNFAYIIEIYKSLT